jgi:hypothetical protein
LVHEVHSPVGPGAEIADAERRGQRGNMQNKAAAALVHGDSISKQSVQIAEE